MLDVSGSTGGTVADASDRMEHRPVACASDESAAKRVKLEHEPASSPTTATPARPAGVGALSSREKLHAVERDYTHYFALDVGGETGADQFVFQHFNTLCMVGIAPSSSAFAGRKVSQVDFDVGRGGDKADSKVSGKKKHGATQLSEASRLCDLVCDDGTRVKVRSAVQGILLELNSRLKEQPDLINSKAMTEGFIAIIQPKKDIAENVRAASNLLTADEYDTHRPGALNRK